MIFIEIYAPKGEKVGYFPLFDPKGFINRSMRAYAGNVLKMYIEQGAAPVGSYACVCSDKGADGRTEYMRIGERE